jgi:hypothetical protein
MIYNIVCSADGMPLCVQSHSPSFPSDEERTPLRVRVANSGEHIAAMNSSRSSSGFCKRQCTHMFPKDGERVLYMQETQCTRMFPKDGARVLHMQDTQCTRMFPNDGDRVPYRRYFDREWFRKCTRRGWRCRSYKHRRVSTQHTAHSTQHTVHSTQHTSHSSQHTAHSTQLTAHSTQHTAHSTQHTAHSSQHTAHSTQHAVSLHVLDECKMLDQNRHC